jgi:hypothetical protein
MDLSSGFGPSLILGRSRRFEMIYIKRIEGRSFPAGVQSGAENPERKSPASVKVLRRNI